jgi:hypothetical protein
MGDWRKLAGLSWADRRLLARAAAMLAHAKLALPSTGFGPDREAPAADSDIAVSPAMLSRAQAIARLVGVAASRVPFRVACLHRSIVLWRLLRRERIPCELRLGARTGAGPFGAHAWVECGGVALGEDPAHLASYRPFDRAVVPDPRDGPLPKSGLRRPT